jgi:hypothetical protein
VLRLQFKKALAIVVKEVRKGNVNEWRRTCKEEMKQTFLLVIGFSVMAHLRDFWFSTTGICFLNFA